MFRIFFEFFYEEKNLFDRFLKILIFLKFSENFQNFFLNLNFQNPLILATAPKIYAIICELVDKWEKKFEATVDSETVQYLASSAGFYYGFDYNRVEEIRDFLRDSEVV